MLATFFQHFPTTSLEETVSVLMAIGRTFFTASFCSAAMRMLLIENKKTSDKGWWLCKKFALMDEEHEEGGKIKLSLRFGKYSKLYILEDGEKEWCKRDWKHAISSIVPIFEQVRKLKNITQAHYNCLHRNIMKFQKFLHFLQIP